MGVVEPAADVITGGVLARSLEQPTGVDESGHTAETRCLNCRERLDGNYCRNCGQKAHVHRSLGAFAHDLLHGVFHFEGKIWRTLPLLIARPGQLTRRYIEGERATFVSPLAMFLFSVFLMFATLGATGALDFEGTASGGAPAQKAAPAAPTSTIVDGSDPGPAKAEPTSGLRAFFSDFNDAYRNAKKNPDLMLYKLRSNGYKYSWALIPLSLPLMWLLFPFSRRFTMYDHAVFVTYSLCFMTLLAVVITLLIKAGLPPPTILLALVAPVHIVAQLKGAYRLSWWSTLWRSVPLLGGTVLIAIIFMVGILAMGVYE